MNVGTAGPIGEKEAEREAQIRTTRLFGGGTSGRGGNDGGGGDEGGGGDRPGPDGVDADWNSTADKTKYVTWFLLLVVLMTFGGLLGAYVVLSTNGAAEWRPFDLPPQVWISTTLIFLSSITYHLAKTALFAERYGRSKKLMIATTALGGAFISSQLLVWLALVKRGLYMSGNPYAGFFYILTAAHAIHVLGGIVALGVILLRTWHPTRDEAEALYRRNLARSVGWYWHFMGVLWLVLFIMLGFWR